MALKMILDLGSTSGESMLSGHEDKIDIDQPYDRLSKLGYKSGSLIINMLSFLSLLMYTIIFHLLSLVIALILRLLVKKISRIKSWCDKRASDIFAFFHLAYYIQLLL